MPIDVGFAVKQFRGNRNSYFNMLQKLETYAITPLLMTDLALAYDNSDEIEFFNIAMCMKQTC